MKPFKYFFLLSSIVFAMTQCTENNYYGNSNSGNNENLDSALFGIWTETSADQNNNFRRLNIAFTSDGKCVTYWSYPVTNGDTLSYSVQSDQRTYWTISDQIFSSHLNGDYQDVGNYEVTNGELYLWKFSRFNDWNDRTLTK